MADETEAQEDTKKGGNPRGKTPAARGDGTEAQEDTKRDPLQLAVQLADRVAIKNVMLSRCEVNRSPNLDPTAAPLTVQNSVSEIRFGKDVESNVLFALPTFTLESIQRDENTNEPKLSIKASFVLFYSLDSFEGIEDEQLGAFSATNGVFNAWPYWREFVQNMAARMGLATPIVIPVFRLGQTQSTEQIGAPESLEK